MRRRALLSTAGALAVGASAGCLDDRQAIGASETVPTEIVAWEFTQDVDEDALPAREDPPRIGVEGDATVVVEGYFRYPSGNCEELVIDRDRTEYDPDDGALSVWVGWIREAEPGEDCTLPESTTGYRIRVTFDEGLPERVTATERGGDGERTAREP